jgi:two-component system chemotaxis sensor kinase CheA
VRRLAARIQEAATTIRLVPLSSTFTMLRRFAREKAPALGKEVVVDISGGDTELDKAVGERLLDPLKHLVRNALDHGIEPAARRAALGKPARGRISLAARAERGAVVVTVEDDGGGLDLDRIRAVARARGLLGDAEEPGDAAILDLVFVPGFTTAEHVGELSGRGVGLDVVRQNVQELGGDVRVESRPGLGTRFVLDVPLTLSVLEGLVVQCGGERLIVPIDVVKTLVRPAPGQIRRLPHGGEILFLATGAVPLVRPGALFGGAGGSGADAVAVIVDVGGRPAALHTDAVLSQEAVMLKSLQRNLRAGEGTLGAAVLGDGRVALVVDVPTLVARAEGLATA